MVTKFELSLDQQRLATQWMEGRELTSPSMPTAIGGRFTFEFTQTSVGVVAIVRDAHDDVKLVLTDYDNW